MSARNRKGAANAQRRAAGKVGPPDVAGVGTVRWEHYIEAIDEVSRRKSYAKVRDVSRALGVRLPTVSEMFSKLSEAGLVN